MARLPCKPDLRHVGGDSVPYGLDIAVKGGKVWACFHEGRLVCVAATEDAARRKYRKAYWEQSAAHFHPEGRKLNG
jgi:hypothetical protein